MSLQKSIKDGEGKTIEFKAELPNSHALAKTIIAFSNTGGGKLIIGVNDQGTIIGLKPDENIFELKDKVASIIYETCYPTVLPDIYTTTIDDQLLLIIEVYRGNLLPYYLKNKGKNEADSKEPLWMFSWTEKSMKATCSHSLRMLRIS